MAPLPAHSADADGGRSIHSDDAEGQAQQDTKTAPLVLPAEQLALDGTQNESSSVDSLTKHCSHQSSVTSRSSNNSRKTRPSAPCWSEQENRDCILQSDIADSGLLAPSTTSTPRKELLEKQYKLQRLFEMEDWVSLLHHFEDAPELSRLPVHIQCQGERTPVLPIHAAVARRRPCLDLLEQLATIHPEGVRTVDSRGKRLPMHFSLLKGSTSLAIVRYLHRLHPSALPTEDVEGNLPLHYAAQYGSEAVCQWILEQYPKACELANGKERFVLHLLAARCWDEHEQQIISLKLFQSILEAYPEAASIPDRYGRLPLHWACAQTNPRWDVLQLLIQANSAALLVKDKAKQTPLQLAKQLAPRNHHHQTDNDVVEQFLHERTVREKRKQNNHVWQPLDKFFTIRVKNRRRKNACNNKPSLLNCYG